MPCYSPLTAYKCISGEIVFSEHKAGGDYYKLQLPCGQCIGCRLERSRQWAIRCMHEAQMHKQNCWLTLTYDEEHVPKRGLNKEDYQNFLKRYRLKAWLEEGKKIRYYMCGEYGTENGRPHYHLCIFGHDFTDGYYWCNTPRGDRLYRSPTLEKLWTYGQALIGDLTFDSAGYTARYCTTKVTGSNAEQHYRRVDENGEYQLMPEFNAMSLKPGIGTEWYKKYRTDVYPRDYVVVNYHECKPPKYYDQLYERDFPDEHEYMKEHRILKARERWEDNTPERLKVKETVVRAKIKALKRD